MVVSLISGDNIVNTNEINWLYDQCGRPSGNYSIPIHRWFRFPAGFSSRFIMSVLSHFVGNSKDKLILDPCGGTATTNICCKMTGLKSIGVEAHPLLHRVGKIKCNWQLNADELKSHIEMFLSELRHVVNDSSIIDLSTIYPTLVRKCFTEETLTHIHLALEYINRVRNTIGEDIYDVLWLGLLCVLRKVSHVGTAPWQYILPAKSKENTHQLTEALEKQLNVMLEDIVYVQNHFDTENNESLFIEGDCRNMRFLNDKSVSFSICSPPYLNNFDYADATRLEMYIFKYFTSWKDITTGVRDRLIVSATTQVFRTGFDPAEILKSIDPLIQSKILDIVKELTTVRPTKSGKKNYDIMVARYFADTSLFLKETARVMKNDSMFIMIVGDSAPYGVYIPTDKLLAELALTTGFSKYQLIKLRDRNILWNNRKHRIPLRETAIFLQK